MGGEGGGKAGAEDNALARHSKSDGRGWLADIR